MRNTQCQVAKQGAGMLDEDVVMTVLSQHFPGAGTATVRRAAEDVLLLELLARDVGVVWEDAMSEEPEQANVMSVFDSGLRRDS